MSTADNRLMTRKEAAEYLRVSEQTLRSWAVTGRHHLPMAKIGNAVRYRKSDLDKWIESRTVTNTGEAERLDD